MNNLVKLAYNQAYVDACQRMIKEAWGEPKGLTSRESAALGAGGGFATGLGAGAVGATGLAGAGLGVRHMLAQGDTPKTLGGIASSASNAVSDAAANIASNKSLTSRVTDRAVSHIGTSVGERLGERLGEGPIADSVSNVLDSISRGMNKVPVPKTKDLAAEVVDNVVHKSRSLRGVAGDTVGAVADILGSSRLGRFTKWMS